MLFQQTDRAAPPKTVTLAEMENLVEDIEEDDVTPTKEDVPILPRARMRLHELFGKQMNSTKKVTGCKNFSCV